MKKNLSKFNFFCHGILALLPSILKIPLYRLFCGYQIGRGVSIGFSIIAVDNCRIDDAVRIGHLNLFLKTKDLKIGEHTKIGHLNIIRGGEAVDLGRYTEIIRLNEINAIPDPIVSNPVDSRFSLGDGSIVTTSHKIDFTDRVMIGKRSILGGRNSSLWTHNRQETRPITIADYCYVGSEIRMVPGSSIPPGCIVGIGSVISKPLKGDSHLVGGVPARLIKPLDEKGMELVKFKTRMDLPDDIK